MIKKISYLVALHETPLHSILLHMILRTCSAFTGNGSSAIRILLVHVVRPLGNHVIVVYVDHVTLLD